MSNARRNDAFYGQAWVRVAGPIATALYQAAEDYCHRELSGATVPRTELEIILPWPLREGELDAAIELLVRVGRFELVADAVFLPRYFLEQESDDDQRSSRAAQVKAGKARAESARRDAKGRLLPRQPKASHRLDGSSHAGHAGHPAGTNGHAAAGSAPVQPKASHTLDPSSGKLDSGTSPPATGPVRSILLQEPVPERAREAQPPDESGADSDPARSGVSNSDSGSGRPLDAGVRGRWLASIKASELTHVGAIRFHFRAAAHHGLVPLDEAGLLLVAAMAHHAHVHGTKSPAAMFVSYLTDESKRAFLTHDDEAAAQRWFPAQDRAEILEQARPRSSAGGTALPDPPSQVAQDRVDIESPSSGVNPPEVDVDAALRAEMEEIRAIRAARAARAREPEAIEQMESA